MPSNAFLNQFNVQNSVGTLDLQLSPQSLLSVQIYASSVATALYVGDVVLLTSGTSDHLPIVDQVTANTVVQFGVIVYNVKKNTYVKGNYTQIAIDGEYVWMAANTAISAGAAVEWVVADKQVLTQNSGKRIGYALDAASAKGQLIRVKLDFQKA